MVCKECKTDKPLDYFYKSNRSTNGRMHYCKKCHKRKNAKHTTYERRMEVQRKYKYGVTPKMFKEMMEEQNGRCAICKELDTERKSLAVDHDHETLWIRGLLCQPCNRLLGNAKENIDTLKAAIVYLQEG